MTQQRSDPIVLLFFFVCFFNKTQIVLDIGQNIIRQILASRQPLKQGMLTDCRVGQANRISSLLPVYLDIIMKSFKDFFVHQELSSVLWLFHVLNYRWSRFLQNFQNQRTVGFCVLRKKRFRELLVVANIKELEVFVKEPLVRKEVISCMFENFQIQALYQNRYLVVKLAW